jgi:catalase
MISPEETVDRLRRAFGGPGGHRTLHAKGHFYSGSFTATPEAGRRSRATHLDGDTHQVLVRWSNAGGNADAPDTTPDIRGMAVKLQGADGAPFDLLGQTSPRFPTDDPRVFVELTEAAAKPAKLPAFLLRHPRTAARMISTARSGALAKHRSYADPTYYPLHAYGWLDADDQLTWVRYELRPASSDGVAGNLSGPDRLEAELAARLARGPVTYELWARIAGEGDDPHHITSEWRGEEELLVGRIEVTEQLPDPETGGSPTVFDPAREVDGIMLSDDAILRFRPKAYSESISRRSS